MNVFLCVVVPYVCLAIFVVGHFWRYRYDKFGWTTRSSQLYENRLLRIGSPLFHFGMLGVVGGHVIGLLVPQSWTDAVGHQRAHRTTWWPSRAASLAGRADRGRHGDPDLPPPHHRAGLLRHHADGQGHVRRSSAPSSCSGMWNTIAGSILTVGGEYNYREGVSVWFRCIFALPPDPS